MSFRNYKLEITVKSWKRDSYGLFDYDTADIHTQTITAVNPGKVTRSEHRLSYKNFLSFDKTKTKKVTVDEEENLLYVVESSDGVKIYPDGTDFEDAGQFWEVVENGDGRRGKKLKPQDVIKFGRIMLRVTQIKVGQQDGGQRGGLRRSFVNSIPDHMAYSQQHFTLGKFLEEETKKSGKGSNAGSLCRICLCDKNEIDEDDDPLISPCKCIGSVKYVHLKCMQNWVKSKLDIQHDRNVITILWKNMNCELCKEKLPIMIEQNGESLSLVPFDNKLMGSYVVMESFSKDMDSTGIHLIDFSADKNIKLGRGRDSDLKIGDISVSRLHATFTIEGGNLYVKDNHSKFGTLVWHREPILLNPDFMRSKLIQCGRTVLKFSLKKPWIAYIPCLGFCFGSSMRPRDDQGRTSLQKEDNHNDETEIRIVDEDEGGMNDQIDLS